MCMLGKRNNFRSHVMVVEVLLQNADHSTVQYTDCVSVQRFRISVDRSVCVMLNEIIGLAAHDAVRIADQCGAFFTPGKTGQQIDLTLQEHLIQVSVTAVHIFVLPACVFRKFAVILVSVAGLNRTLLSAFLKHFVLVITYSDCFCSAAGASNGRKTCGYDKKCTYKGNDSLRKRPVFTIC